MPTYERFEDLPVWNEAIRLAEGCEDLILAAKERITWSKRDQLDRCSLSVSNNIAEGFERGKITKFKSSGLRRLDSRHASFPASLPGRQDPLPVHLHHRRHRSRFFDDGNPNARHSRAP